ncbi:hypothetical protein D9758_018265 [Tetrapyrgos nigripes]|uniref:Helicase C-terminal domain-containing protein n=1 Tax=Tetrapyrgos nigripes TaxID=182062 RepID=A0A8H5BXY7_9AGAR|nr:hypothetical protein D9758_018265 [Tetrapyrgos nigripes]
MHISLDILKRTPGVPKYAPILEYLCSSWKAVIHVQTIPTAYNIFEFLWEYIPEGPVSKLQHMRMYHALCPDSYNRETFQLMDSDLELQVIITMIGFLVGLNCQKILISIFWKFPSTVDDFVQGGGRAGQDDDEGVICQSVVIVLPNTIKAAQEFIQTAKPTTTSVSNLKQKSGTSSDTPMEEAKALFLLEKYCHVASTATMCNIYASVYLSNRIRFFSKLLFLLFRTSFPFIPNTFRSFISDFISKLHY